MTRKLPRVPVIPTIRMTAPIVQWAWSGTSTVGKAPGTPFAVIFYEVKKKSYTQVYGQILLNKLAHASVEGETVKNVKSQQAKKSQNKLIDFKLHLQLIIFRDYVCHQQHKGQHCFMCLLLIETSGEEKQSVLSQMREKVMEEKRETGRDHLYCI